MGWGAVALAAILVVLAVAVAIQVLGVLYGVLFAPLPPKLDSFSELSHSSPSYGVDDWLYASSDDGCRVVRFYQTAGAECRIAPGSCDSGLAEIEMPGTTANVARCTGSIDWSIFTQRYYVNIAAGYGDDTPTRIRLEREVFWTGILPSASGETR